MKNPFSRIHNRLIVLFTLLFSPLSAALIPATAIAAPCDTTSSICAVASANHPAVVNTPNTVTVVVKNPKATITNAIIDVEVYRTNGERVYQKFFEWQYLSQLSTKTYTFNWTPKTAETFIVKVGVFGAHWSPLHYWTDEAGKITVLTSLPTTQTTTEQSSSATTNQTTTATSPTLATQPTTSVIGANSINVWWPKDGVNISGNQPFKAAIESLPIGNYQMYWQVDNGQLNNMYTSYTDGPHKETWVNVDGWNWRGAGPYTITFVAKDMNGKEIAKQHVRIAVGSTPFSSLLLPPTKTNEPTPVSSPEPSITVPATTEPVLTSPSVSGLYVNPLSPALAQAKQWESTRPTDAALMKKIGEQPSARWFGGWNTNLYQDVKTYVDQAAAVNATPVLVAYNIPQRDCGGHSAGGSNNPETYKTWITSMANAIGNRNALIILEPDATALMDCLSWNDKELRFQLLSYAVNTLEAKPNVRVYIDAGHGKWLSPTEMASRLKKAGITNATGFALNVSNFYTTEENKTYGTELSKLVNHKPFIIDTSRNGNGSNGEWCNPSGRALGEKPTLNTGNSLIDGYLWIKTPGESDGWCNGGPAAGQWWSDYALGLASRAKW